MPLGADANGGVSPLGGRAGAGSANDIARGYMDIDPERYRALIVPMYATLGTSATSGYEQYRAPTTHDFLIERIDPHLVLLDYAGLALAEGVFTLASVGDMILSKANNCLVDLNNVDRTQKIIDNHSMALSQLYRSYGGGPINFGSTPHKLPAGESLRLDVRFANTAIAAQIQGNAQYGLTLVGKLVRVAKS